MGLPASFNFQFDNKQQAMKIKYTLLALVAFVLTLGTLVAASPARYPSATYVASDFPKFPEAWSNVVSKTALTLEEEFRQDTDQGRNFYEHTDLQLKYNVNWNIEAFLSYRLVFEDKAGTSSYNTANVFIPGVTLWAPTNYIPERHGWLSLRSRAELTLEDSNTKANYQLSEFLRYYTPFMFTRYNINPYVGDEMFFDLRNDFTFGRNRVCAGVDFELTKRIGGTLSYYWQNDKKAGDWHDRNLIVLQVRVALN